MISSKWNLLSQLLENNILEYIDITLAKHLSKKASLNESQAAFICYLSMAFRNGHLCVQLENDELTPSPKTLVDPSTCDLKAFIDHVIKGAHSLPKELCSSVNSRIAVETALCHHAHSFYFKGNWHKENTLITLLKNLSSSQTPLTPKLKQAILQELSSKKLLPKQAEAIDMALQYRFSIITGGPGTGKSYTAGKLVKLLWESLSSEEQSEFNVVLTAPTGKAAANLSSSIQKAFNNVDVPELQTKTLHSLLGIGRKGLQRKNHSLSASLILVDEASMIDVSMWIYLLSSLPEKTRIVCIGDSNQLPPVELGSIFADIVEQAQTLEIPYTQLEVCVRATSNLNHLAQAAKQGNLQLIQELENAAHAQFVDLAHTPLKTTHRALIKLAKAHYNRAIKAIDHPLKLLEAFNQFRILSPLRKGPLGVDAINLSCLQTLQHKAAPIMVCMNDYHLGLFNGDMGILFSDSRSTANHYAIFPSQTESGYIKIQAALLPPIEYAYCLSVHKSQGSEYQNVLLVMPEGSEKFGREVLYTGITRAKQSLEIWGAVRTLQESLSKSSRRTSALVRTSIEDYSGKMR